MQPKFLYFDLGKVLVDFSVQQMCRQMGAAAGVDAALVEETVFAGGLQEQCELGRISAAEFHDLFCRRTGSRVDADSLWRAAADIFTLNLTIVPVVAQLAQTGYPLGILSNTCQSHWDYCRRRYRIVADGFCVYALSFRIGECKPHPGIFRAAADLAGCRPEEIFYVDDVAGHVAGALAVGFDAVQYTSTPELVAELHKRRLEFNY
jgi:putative hydrolase of the HAD superfamily